MHKDALVAWEAQFGDFVNGAQIIIDQFIVAAEDKWGQTSGLVLLLPHGYEGRGPSTRSARIERFLTLCAEDNIQVVNATTAAQYFHLLRRQVRRELRKPLVVFTPKSLLRAKQSRADRRAHHRLVPGGARRPVRRRPVDGRAGGAGQRQGRLRRHGPARQHRAPVAVVRVEQLYPWPEEQLGEVLARYESATEVVWLQEEPENMGAWNFVHGRLHRLLRDDFELRHVARLESGSPACGSAAMHQLEQDDLLTRAVAAAAAASSS